MEIYDIAGTDLFAVGLIPLPETTDQTPTATREEG